MPIFLEIGSRYRFDNTERIKIASTCFKRGKQPKVLTTLAGEVQGIVTILGTGGGITKIGEERGKKGGRQRGREGREVDGRQMSRAAGPCDSFNQSLGCVLPRSRTNYVQSCYEFKWKPALPCGYFSFPFYIFHYFPFPLLFFLISEHRAKRLRSRCFLSLKRKILSERDGSRFLGFNEEIQSYVMVVVGRRSVHVYRGVISIITYSRLKYRFPSPQEKFKELPQFRNLSVAKP